MTCDNFDFKTVMLAHLPNLRAFAVSLCDDFDKAGDLVQETLLRAWAHKERFKPGTNLRAWLFTILINYVRTEYRHLKLEVQDTDGKYAEHLTVPEAQTGYLEFGELREALCHLAPDDREALILVVASGFSCKEAAKICGCPVGTIKSRTNRARKKLLEILMRSSV